MLGWTLLILGMATVAILDPWIFSEQNPGDLLNGTRMQLRHAQGVVLAMALLQLAVGYVLTTQAFQPRFNVQSSILTGVGAIFYAGGYALMIWHPIGKWLVLSGCLLNLSAFLKTLRIKIGGSGTRHIQIILPILCFGMFLDLLTSLFILYPNLFSLDWLGNEDEVRLRMLRLARVAVIALTVLTLLYFDLASRSKVLSPAVTWGHRGLLGGTVGMPLVLALACFTATALKYLLPIPATLVCLGAIAGLNLAWKHGTRLECLGWSIITSSLLVGMIIGMYAFDGPLPAPTTMDHYQDLPRRLLRIGHAYAIVLGMLALFIAEGFQKQSALHRIRKIGLGIYIASMAITLSIMTLLAWNAVPVWAAAIGPAGTALGLLLCVINIRPGSTPLIPTTP
ncbi:MAG: hypothetical protein VX644_04560 [Planctomycetota bacterium]|nr:hypothetical protein [Planctomycetota bacterium]